jgi:hypothetical protein
MLSLGFHRIIVIRKYGSLLEKGRISFNKMQKQKRNSILNLSVKRHISEYVHANEKDDMVGNSFISEQFVSLRIAKVPYKLKSPTNRLQSCYQSYFLKFLNFDVLFCIRTQVFFKIIVVFFHPFECVNVILKNTLKYIFSFTNNCLILPLSRVRGSRIL